MSKKKIHVYGTGWSMNSAQILQILASQPRYSICWRCSNIANPQHYETETTISSGSGYQFSHCHSLVGQKARQNTKLPCKFRTWPATEVNETRHAKVKDTLTLCLVRVNLGRMENMGRKMLRKTVFFTVWQVEENRKRGKLGRKFSLLGPQISSS